MTQETTKQEAAKDTAQGVATEPAKELDAQQAEGVGGGALVNVSLDVGSCTASGVGDALINEMERETPDAAKLARSRIEANRRSLRENRYVTAFGTWSPHINGCAVPLWSPQYQTYVVVTIGLLSAMYDEKRIHKEAAPRMLDLAAAVGALLEGDGDIFANRLERKSIPVPAHNNNKIMTEDTNGLEAGARRPRPARSVRARDGRR